MSSPSALWRRQRNWGPRIREFEYLGMRALTLENAFLRVGIFLDRGSDVFEFLYKPRDLDLVWLADGGFRGSKQTLGASLGEGPMAFLDGFGGGWQEVLPNGGAPSRYAGAGFGQHGEVSLLPWDCEIIQDDERAVSVRLSVACVRTPLRLVKELRLEAGAPRLDVCETLTNESPVDIRAMWGHHLAFGPPFLAPEARIRIAEGAVVIADRELTTTAPPTAWPRAISADGEPIDLSVLPGTGAPSDVSYVTGLPERAWYEIVRGEVAVRVDWDARVMPYLWFWREFGATTGYPWYGRHWNIGLEPFAGYPTDGLAAAVANGSALTLGAGEERSFSLAVDVRASDLVPRPGSDG